MNTLSAASIVANALRMGIDAFHTATGLDLAAPVDGVALDPVHRIGIGGCECCAYTGRDVLVAALPG